jgi:phenol/toluene 2-monooxygenase (NADH) P0/A0
MQAHPMTSAKPAFDVNRRYVRLRELRADGFVEFEFAIGDPELAVDLILPADAYRNFCRDNHAVPISPLQGAAIDHARLRWSTNDRACAPFPSTPEGDDHVG